MFEKSIAGCQEQPEVSSNRRKLHGAPEHSIWRLSSGRGVLLTLMIMTHAGLR